MNNRLHAVFSLPFILTALILCNSCGGSSDSNSSWPYGEPSAEAGMAILPVNPSIAKGTTIQFQAVGKDDFDNTFYLTKVAWYSSDTSVATIENVGGKATGLKAGTTTISAWFNDQRAGFVTVSTTLTVTE